MSLRVYGRLVRFTEPGLAVGVGSGGLRDQCVQPRLCVPRFCQTVGVVALAIIALLQLVAGCLERTLILIHDLPLKGQLLLKGREAGIQPRGGLLEVLYTGSRQLEEALRLLDLLVHRADIAGKVVRLQRQADNEVAQGFWHGSHLLLWS